MWKDIRDLSFQRYALINNQNNSFLSSVRVYTKSRIVGRSIVFPVAFVVSYFHQAEIPEWNRYQQELSVGKHKYLSASNVHSRPFPWPCSLSSNFLRNRSKGIPRSNIKDVPRLIACPYSCACTHIHTRVFTFSPLLSRTSTWRISQLETFLVPGSYTRISREASLCAHAYFEFVRR